jgi:hypothetical protein
LGDGFGKRGMADRFPQEIDWAAATAVEITKNFEPSAEYELQIP